MLRQARLDVPGILERKGKRDSFECCSSERKFQPDFCPSGFGKGIFNDDNRKIDKLCHVSEVWQDS
jgi:hypothetical protein